MKKYIIPVIIFFVISIGSVIFFVSSSYTLVQYKKDTRYHITTLQENETLTATYKEVTTQVVGRNSSRIYSLLTVSEIKQIHKKPTYAENNAIQLNFSDGATYIVVEDPSINDSIFILYSYKNKKLYFKISGYNSLEWTEKAISPEGLFNENILIDTNVSSN